MGCHNNKANIFLLLQDLYYYLQRTNTYHDLVLVATYSKQTAYFWMQLFIWCTVDGHYAVGGRSLFFQIHSIRIQNEIQKSNSYVCIDLIVHVLLMWYILGSPTGTPTGTPTHLPTDPPLTSKTTDYTVCS